MATAEAVARYFLHLAAQSEEPTLITQMHLHKLVYYAQGWHLGVNRRPLFESNFQAWTHGPVDARLYSKFADYGANPLAPHEGANDPSLTPRERSFIESIWHQYQDRSAIALRNQTHRELPWKSARGAVPEGQRSNAPISDLAMREFFESQHRQWCSRHRIDADELFQASEDVRAGRVHDFDQVCSEAELARRPA